MDIRDGLEMDFSDCLYLSFLSLSLLLATRL